MSITLESWTQVSGGQTLLCVWLYSLSWCSPKPSTSGWVLCLKLTRGQSYWTWGPGTWIFSSSPGILLQRRDENHFLALGFSTGSIWAELTVVENCFTQLLWTAAWFIHLILLWGCPGWKSQRHVSPESSPDFYILPFSPAVRCAAGPFEGCWALTSPKSV